MTITSKFHSMGILAACLLAAGAADAGEIHDAVKSRDAARLERAIRGNPAAVNEALPKGVTALHMAAAMDAADMVRMLVAKGAALNAQTDSGATPLHWAALKNAAAAARALVVAGADTSIKAIDGMTPLDLARQKNSADTARVLAVAGSGIARPQVERPAAAEPMRTGATGSFADGIAALKAGKSNAAYEIFLALLKKDPANENCNFALGLAAFSLRKYSHASMAFERVLCANPANDRAKLELGRTYYATGQFDLARQTFEDVLSRDPPARVKESIDDMMRTMGAGGLRKPLTARVELGILYDDNANVGPDADLVRISPIVSGNSLIDTIPVGEESKPIRTIGGAVSAALSGGRELGRPGGWSLSYGGMAYGSMLENRARDLEIIFGGLTAGLRRDGRESALHIPARWEHIEQGGESLVDIYGVAPSLAWSFGSGSAWQSTLSGVAEFRNYSDLNDRDGPYYALGAALSRLLGDRSSAVSGSATFFFEDADAGIYANAGGEVSATYERRLPWNMAAFARAGYARLYYAERETLAPEKRRDSQYRLSAGIEKKIASGWCVNAGWRLTDNDSTFDLYEYKRNLFSVSMAYRY